MYNRYVPQSDGSYRRNRVEDPGKPPRPSPPPKPAQLETCPPKEEPMPHPQRPCNPHQGKQIGGFLRQLLPKEFDTADLIIVLLLLLLAGDCEEDRTTAMLTLVLYLFL